MDCSNIIQDIRNGDATAPEIDDWCFENNLDSLPKEVLTVFLEEVGDDDYYLIHDLSVDDGFGSYINLDLLKFLVEKGVFSKCPEWWFDVFSSESSSWDDDILNYLLVDLKLKPRQQIKDDDED